MRTSILITLLLLLLLPLSQASVLSVKVVVDQDTPSIGASVSLMTGGIELSTQKADQNGMVRFNASDGTYFISVAKSSIYPQYVVLKEISGDTAITVVRRQLINYASVYGQITGPANFSNTAITAYSNGQITKRAFANKDGFYMMSFLPDGTYELRFESPGFENTSVQALLPSSMFTPIYMALKAPVPPAEPEVALSAPYQVQQFSPIEILLTRGGLPFAGQEISVSTPSGKITATTDSQGIARVNAAEGGSYSFSFGNLSSSTAVSVPEVPLPQQNQTQNGTTAPTQPNQPSTPAQAASDSNGVLLPLAIGLGIFALVVLLAIVAVAAKMVRDGGKKGDGAGAAHSHGHPHGSAGARQHGATGMHPHEEGAHEHGHHHGGKSHHKGK